MWRQLPRAAEPDATLLRTLPALARPGHDQLTLELGQAAEHSQHQPAMGCCGIGPSILEALEAGATFADGSQTLSRSRVDLASSRSAYNLAGLRPEKWNVA